VYNAYTPTRPKITADGTDTSNAFITRMQGTMKMEDEENEGNDPIMEYVFDV